MQVTLISYWTEQQEIPHGKEPNVASICYHISTNKRCHLTYGYFCWLTVI